MKPHEILQKIIDEKGKCEWVNTYDLEKLSFICRRCPMGGANNSATSSCMDFVSNAMGDMSDENYVAMAQRVLVKIESERILLGSDSDS